MYLRCRVSMSAPLIAQTTVPIFSHHDFCVFLLCGIRNSQSESDIPGDEKLGRQYHEFLWITA